MGILDVLQTSSELLSQNFLNVWRRFPNVFKTSCITLDIFGSFYVDPEDFYFGTFSVLMTSHILKTSLRQTSAGRRPKMFSRRPITPFLTTFIIDNFFFFIKGTQWVYRDIRRLWDVIRTFQGLQCQTPCVHRISHGGKTSSRHKTFLDKKPDLNFQETPSRRPKDVQCPHTHWKNFNFKIVPFCEWFSRTIKKEKYINANSILFHQGFLVW